MKTTDAKHNIYLSIILPCLNEEQALIPCLDTLKKMSESFTFSTEVILVDNGSTDASATIIKSYKSIFPELVYVEEKRKGYGAAYQKGFESASGKYIYIADCDFTYDFSEIPLFIQQLEKGNDLVIGNRFAGLMEKGSMEAHRKYIGNPFLSFLTRRLFKIDIHDLHSGARAIKKEKYNTLHLHTTGMEFALEMIVKASQKKLTIAEIPIKYKRRIGISKLNSFSDGWRHLRYMLYTRYSK